MTRQTPQRDMMYLFVFGALIAVATAAWAMWTPPGPRAGRLPTVIAAPPVAIESAPSSLAPLPSVEPPVTRPKSVRTRRSSQRGRTLSPLMQAVLTMPDHGKHIVMDAAAVRDSALGKAVLNCLLFEGYTELTQLKRDTGFDPIQQVQRLGFTGDMMVLEGDFGAVDWLGISDRIALQRQADGVDFYINGFQKFAVIEGKYLIEGEPEQVEAALQRIEDGVVEGAPTLRGAVSGRVPLLMLFDMLPVSSDVRKSMLGLLARGIDLKIDINDDGAQFDFALEQVDPRLKEAIKAGVEAVKGGDVDKHFPETLTWLVDGTTIDDSDDALRIRTPVTMAHLDHALGDCMHRDRPVD